MDSPSSENAINIMMESPASDIKPVASFQLFTKAERIKQLNDIDKSITKMLHSAGLAVKTLTTYQTDSTAAEDRLQSFTDATNTYLEGLHSIDVRLKRQIYGLQEAGIIAMVKESPSRSDGQNPDTSRVPGDSVALDVGWLNSRSGKVGRDMEAELWGKARTFMEALEKKKKKHCQGEIELENDHEDQDMGV